MSSDIRVLVTGITSIHGWPVFQRLQRELPPGNLFGIRPPKMSVPSGHHIQSICITDTLALKKIRSSFNPTHIIHCAGVCDLNVCEERPEWATRMNGGGAESVVSVFGDLPILYMSSDLVYSGVNPPAGGYEEKDVPEPVSVVGKTILEAERVISKREKHCIVRLGLPLGPSITGTKGSEDWIESRFKRNLPVTLFVDEWRSCPSCADIGWLGVYWLKDAWRGLYHFGGKKTWNLYEIGEMVLFRGGYSSELLNSMSRKDEKNGPPRIGNVALNSSLIKKRA